MRLPGAVLFDMDGTLVDTEAYWIEAEHDLVAEHGGRWSEELAHQLVGNDLLVSGRFIRDNSPVDWEPERIVEELLRRVSRRIREHLPWRPGAQELLAQCRRHGIPTALVTMSWRAVTDAVIEALPAGCGFDIVVTGDAVARGKPDPEPYALAARLLGLPPERCVAIEDSATGTRSATGAGVPTIAIPHIVDIPPMRGSVQVSTLAGVGPADLVDLTSAAAAQLAAV